MDDIDKELSIDASRQLGRAAFDTTHLLSRSEAITTNSIQQRSAGGLAALSNSAFLPHPASPAAAEILKAQGAAPPNAAAAEQKTFGQSDIELSASSQRSDRRSTNLLAASTTSAANMQDQNVVVATLSSVFNMGVPVDIMQSLLRETTTQTTTASGSGATTATHQLTASAASQQTAISAPVAAAAAEGLNIHQGQGETAAPSAGTEGALVQYSLGMGQQQQVQQVAVAPGASSALSAQLNGIVWLLAGDKVTVPSLLQVTPTSAAAAGFGSGDSRGGNGGGDAENVAVQVPAQLAVEQPVLITTAPAVTTTATKRPPVASASAQSKASNTAAATAANKDQSRSQSQHQVEDDDLESLRKFVSKYKQRRAQLGYTQTSIGKALADFHNGSKEFSQTTLCRFENMQLSYANMCKLRPMLEKWMDAAGSPVANSTSPPTKRRNSGGAASAPVTPGGPGGEVSQATAGVASATGTSGVPTSLNTPANGEAGGRRTRQGNNNHRSAISNAQREKLIEIYKESNKLTPEQLTKVSNDLDLPKATVRIWFCNRRQGENRIWNIMNKKGMS